MPVARLKRGETIVGTMVRMVRNPAVALIARNAGLDFFMLDMEHGSYGLETIADAMRIARLAGVGGFVRVPELSKAFVSGALDAGATGIMVPMIETAEQAEKLAHWGKFAPVGGRGFGSAGDHTGYLASQAVAFMPQANDETLTIAQIESKTAIENIDAIAAVEGIDALLIGPNDLANSLGIPGDLFAPKSIDSIMEVARAAKRAGKILGMHGPDKLIEMLIPEGLRLIMSGLDVSFLTQAMAAVAAKYKHS